MMSSVETEGAAHVSDATRHRIAKYSRATRLEMQRDHQNISTLCHPACCPRRRRDRLDSSFQTLLLLLQGEPVLRLRPQLYLPVRHRASLHGRAVATTDERVRERQVFLNFVVGSAVPPLYSTLY